MKSPSAFIIKLPKKFKDKITVGGQELDLVNKFQEFENRYMEAEIISVPVAWETGAKPGDTLYFHHHVVLNSHYNLGDDLYFVPFHPKAGRNNLANAYANGDTFVPLGCWVFLEPMESSRKMTSAFFEIVQNDVQNDRGRVWGVSEELEELGVTKGDVVYFSKNSDYEMEVDGKKLWRMTTDDLLYAETN